MLFQVLVLLQFLVVAIIVNRKHPQVLLIELLGTSIISLFLVIYIIIKYKTWKHGAFNLLVVIAFSLFIGFNIERVVFSDYYVILANNIDKMETVVNSKDFKEDVFGIYVDLKYYKSDDGVTYFYYELESPLYYGIAYKSNKQLSSVEFDAYGIIDKWIKLYGDWYFFISKELY